MTSYKKGDKGDIVRQIQSALNIDVDGIFGPKTEEAVKKFQTEHHLVVDGIVGTKTMESLASLFGDTDLNGMFHPEKLKIENYFLPSTEYINGKYLNDYIVLHHTAGHDNPFSVVDCWAKDKLGRIATEFIIGGQNCMSGRNVYDGQVIRSFPEGNQGYHIGNSGSSYMNTHSVGIEICSMGYVKDGKVYTGSNIIDSQICKTERFRGFTEWHRYSDEQIKSLKNLLIYISERDNIDLHVGLYKLIKEKGVQAFEFNQEIYSGNVKGIITHANIRKDKCDVFPQQELIDMIMSL